MEPSTPYAVAIIGAGPAGLFAARELALRGNYVAIFNRDIKPGGLAEYGIYPDKLRMKEGLRNQFRQILAQEKIDYYGNVLVGQQPHSTLTLDDLRAMGFQAILVTVGAQSTKRLGIPGEDLSGVYHAKDIVYHYNLLPPFSESTYQISKRVAVIGVGNVMVDIVHWLISEKHVDQVTSIARRGPAEVKFDRKELEAVVNYLDRPAFEAELERVRPVMQAIGQMPDALVTMIDAVSKKAPPAEGNSCFSMRFLSSPIRVIGDAAGRAAALEVEDNTLIAGENGDTRAVGTGHITRLEFETIIFAIGDVVDERFGLPVQRGEFAKNPEPRFPVEGNSYEAYDPTTGEPISDVFLAGWARRPSTGLVGIARKDGTNAAHVVAEYLDTIQPSDACVADRVRERFAQSMMPVVDKITLLRLETLERERAKALGVEAFKFGSNNEMLGTLGLIKAAENQSE